MKRDQAARSGGPGRTENPGVGGSISSLPTSFLAPFHDTGSVITTPLVDRLRSHTVSVAQPRLHELMHSDPYAVAPVDES